MTASKRLQEEETWLVLLHYTRIMSRRGVKSQRGFKQGKRSGGSEETKKDSLDSFFAIPDRAAADSFVPRSGYYSVLAGYWAAGSQEQARGQRQLSASSGNYRRDASERR